MSIYTIYKCIILEIIIIFLTITISLLPTKGTGEVDLTEAENLLEPYIEKFPNVSCTYYEDNCGRTVVGISDLFKNKESSELITIRVIYLSNKHTIT